MSFKLSPVLRQRFFDANGEPLAGGKLYSYVASTTAPKATYTDASGSVANPNPVILDADGYADVWLSLDNVAYKFVLHDADDNPLWTVDNVNMIQTNPVNNVQFQNGVSGPLLTLQPPTPITPGGYTLTLPTIPANKSFVTLDTSGNMAADVSLTQGIHNTMIFPDLTADKFASGTQLPIVTPAVKTVNYNPVAADGEVIYDTTAGALSGTLYAISGAPGYTIRIKNQASLATCTNLLTIFANGTDTINGAISTTLAPGDVVVLCNNGSGNWHILSRQYPLGWFDGGAVVLASTGGVPSKGTTLSDKIYWRRVGNTMVCRVQLYSSSGAGAGTGFYKIQTPSPWPIDSSLVLFDPQTFASIAGLKNVVGELAINFLNANLKGNVTVFDSTHVFVSGMLYNAGVLSYGYWGAALAPMNVANYSVNGTFQVPIAGWEGL